MATVTSGSNYYNRASIFASGDTITMMCWFYPTTIPSAGNYAAILSTTPFAAATGIAMQLHAALFGVGTADNDFDSATSVSVNTWNHGAIIRSGTTKTGYLNGVQAGTGTDADVLGVDMSIGHGGSGTTPLLGRIAAVKVWNAQLTVAEIQIEMRQIAPYRFTNLLAFWPMWTVADDETDYFTGGRTLTVTGTPTTAPDGPPVPFRLQRSRKSKSPYQVSAAVTGKPWHYYLQMRAH